MSNVFSAVTLELPKSNRFWSDERLKKFLTDHDMQKFADCAACAMGLETSQGQPFGKVFRMACSDQVLATGLEKRLQCECTQDHAPLNQVNYSMTETYSYQFARFYCRAIALRWIDQQEEARPLWYKDDCLIVGLNGVLHVLQSKWNCCSPIVKFERN